MEARFVYVTCGSQAEAEDIGTALIEDHLAACVNIIPGMTSMYWWQGKVEKDQEIVLVAKTQPARVAALTERVKALHSYDLPCVVALPLVDGNADFLQWIHNETQKAESA